MRTPIACLAGALSLTLALPAGNAAAYEPLVEKQSFTIPEFTTQSGEIIREMTLGWEASSPTVWLSGKQVHILDLRHTPHYSNNDSSRTRRPFIRSLSKILVDLIR